MSSLKAFRNLAASATTAAKTTASTKAGQEALTKLSKWGIPAAVVGVGSYAVPVAFSAGVEQAFGVDAENPVKTAKKLSGWAILIVIAIIAAVVILPRIKKRR